MKSLKLKVQSKNSAFSLIEVVVAIFILGTALVGISQMFRLGVINDEVNEKRLVALNLLQRTMETIRGYDFNTIASETRAAVSDFPDYEIEITKTDISGNLKKVLVTTYWQSDTGQPASQQVATLIANASAMSQIAYSHTTWATAFGDSGQTGWLNHENAYDSASGPNDAWATVTVADYRAFLAGFTSGGHTEAITKVEVCVYLYLDSPIVDDELRVLLKFNGSTCSAEYSLANLNDFVGSDNSGATYVTLPDTDAPGGTWDWSDFDGDLEIKAEFCDVATSDGVTCYVDAAGFRATYEAAE